MKIIDFGPAERHYHDRFLSLPRRVYAHDPEWVPPLVEEERALLFGDRGFYDEGEARFFLVERGDGDLARACAFFHPRMKSGTRQEGAIGFFESIPNPDAARMVLESAESFLRSRGVKTVRLPVDMSTWFRWRTVVQGHEKPTVMGDIHNPGYYPHYFEGMGYRPVATYHSLNVTDQGLAIASYMEGYNKASGHGVSMRTIDLRRFRSEMGIVYEIAQEQFRHSTWYMPVPFEEFLSIYEPLAPWLDEDLVIFACDRSGAEVGVSFGIPDHSRVLKQLDGDVRPLREGVLPFVCGTARDSVWRFVALSEDGRRLGAGRYLALLHHYASMRGGYRSTYHLGRRGMPRESELTMGNLHRVYQAFGKAL